jgi:hypothetical protein
MLILKLKPMAGDHFDIVKEHASRIAKQLDVCVMFRFNDRRHTIFPHTNIKEYFIASGSKSK